MLNEIEYSHYSDRCRLIDPARRYIDSARTSGPSRPVQSGSKKNRCTAVASRKMALTIQTESETAESVIVRELEFDDDVHEYLEQPPAVPVTRTDSNGRAYTGFYTPDLLVLGAGGPRVLEVKLSSEIAARLEESPDEWKLVDGVPHYLPGDAAFALIGIPFEVVIADTIPPVRSSNLGTLLRARDVTSLITEDLREGVEKAFSTQACMPLEELAKRLKLDDYTPFFQLIEQKELFARLGVDSLTMPKTAWVARQERFLSALDLPSPQTLVEKAAEQPVAVPSEASAAHALQRMERLGGDMAERTRKRLRALIREGAKAGKTLFDSLVPGYSRCGNRRPRLNPLQVQLINEIIDSAYASNRRTDKKNAYRCYAVKSRERYPEFRIVTPKTFREFIARRDPGQIAGARGGRRCANAAAGPSPVESRVPAPTRPFERATIDHCQLPLYVVLYDRGKEPIVRQPWVTAMRDVATGCILAVWLSLNDPSCVADAMVIRRCVRTWGRLPEHVCTDRGRDFWSNYFRFTLAHYGVDHSLSPPGNSRSNSPAERPFGDMRTVWLQLRPGNSANAANARSISRTHKAARTAELTLDEAWSELLMFVDWFNNRPMDLSGASSMERLRAGLQAFSCSGIPVADDLEFKISSAVDVRQYKFDPKDGLRVNDRRYWCPALAERRPALGKVKVRIDPEEPFVVYALINNAWHRCHTNGAAGFSRLTLIEKLTEATRLLDGRELTRRVREESQQEFTRKVLQTDAKRESKQVNSVPSPKEQIPLPIPRSLFDEVRDIPVDPLTDEELEVSAYALDRIRHR